MANLTCGKCQGVFEVPAEHASAPQLGCPFCGNVVTNVHAGGPSVNTGPRVVVDGLNVETRKVDPNRKKEKKKKTKKEEEVELVPEADPQLASPPPGFGGGPMMGGGFPPAPAGGGAFGGIPAPAQVAAALQVDEEDDEDEEDEEDDEEEDYSAPQSSAPMSMGGDYQGTDIELPDGVRLPSSGRGLLIFLVITLVAVDLLFIFAGLGNGGILHFKRLGDTFSAAFGSADPMEIADARPQDEEVDEDFKKPLRNTTTTHNFRIDLSPPQLIDMESGLSVVAVYGFIENTTGMSWKNVNFTGHIVTSGGRELATSPQSAVLPSELATANTASAAIDVLKQKGTVADINAWFGDIRTQAENVKLTSNTPKPFLLVFTAPPSELTVDYLFGVKITRAEPVLE